MASVGTRYTTAAENPLCTKLKTKYSGRIANACDPRREAAAARPRTAGPRSQGAQKARSVANPFADTVEFTPAKAKELSRTQKVAASTAKASPASERRSADSAARRVRAYEKTTPFSSGAFSGAYRRAADIRARAYDGTEAAASVKRDKERKKAAEAPTVFSGKWWRSIVEGRTDEVRVKSSPISVGAIIAILVIAAAVLMVIFTLSEINSFKRDIAVLEYQKEQISMEIDKYYLEIDRKNDIKVIEKAATEDIGMVKSNQVESRYITVSEGERVEVVENGEKTGEDAGIFSTLLSTFANNWETLRDYID